MTNQDKDAPWVFAVIANHFDFFLTLFPHTYYDYRSTPQHILQILIEVLRETMNSHLHAR